VSATANLTLVLVTGLPGTGKSTMAEVAAEALGAPVLAHDWAMSGLRPYPEIQEALDEMDPPGHGAVGWSIISALARQQLRRGSSVVLDGVARTPEVERCHELAHEEHAQMVLVVTQCGDPDVHRSRVEDRKRLIPHWYELDWDQVNRARDGWEPLEGVDLVLEAIDPREENEARLRAVLAGLDAR
jgi:predicted kinase